MSTPAKLAVTCALALCAGLLANGVGWHPDPQRTYLGFPVPFFVQVRLADGTFDCGVWQLGFVLNPLLYVALALAGFGLVRFVRRRSGA